MEKRHIFKSLLVIIFCLEFIIISCKYKYKTDDNRFVIELPNTSKKYKPNYNFEITKKISNELLLSQIWEYNNIDTFELRLWINTCVTNGGKVFVIKKIDNQWMCFLYSYIENHKDWISLDNIFKYINNITIDTFCVKKLQPKSNWNNFFKQIEKENIYKLPSQDEIKGWKNIVEDGVIFTFEIRTINKYKFYYYNCPDVYEKNFIECKHMTNILDIFDKEFGINLGMLGSYKCRQ